MTSEYQFPSLPTVMARLSLCIDVKAPAGLKKKASDTEL
jgi:hypothetical protein